MIKHVLDIVEDRLLGERLRLLQPRRGHRAGTDAILLAATVEAGFVGHIADLGAGVGTVGLAATMLNSHTQATLVERDPPIAELAAQNIILNDLEKRVQLAAIDLFSTAERHSAKLKETADLVLTNPPFLEGKEVRQSPNPEKRSAHVLEGGSLDDWLRACTDVAKPGGRITIVHRADALHVLLEASKKRIGGITIRFIHPYVDAPASRLLLSGVKGSRAPLRILPPLVLHVQDKFSAEMQAINHGQGRISMGL